MASRKQRFLHNPTINPKTNKTITIGDETYHQLAKKYGYPKITSPVTQSKIAIGKGTYYKLIKEGMSEVYLLSLLIPKVKESNQVILPNDMLYEITRHLKTHELLSFCMVNQKLHQYCQNNKNLNILIYNLQHKKLACGYSNTFMIKDSKLYGIGSNSHGQIGMGVQSKGYGVSLKEMIIPNNFIPLSVSCGKDHTLVITTDGLYGCGRNHHGQLTGKEKHLTLTKINTPGKVLSIACNDTTSYIITSEGLYYSGYNQVTRDNVDLFTKIDLPNPMLVSCSGSHTVVMTKEGVYWFGNMRGDANPQPPQYVDLEDILDISAGENYTMILTVNGLYGLGANYHGQLGIGIISNYEEKPVLCPISNVKHISCQFNTTFILTNDGLVYVCGTNNGLVNQKIYRLPDPVPLSLTNITHIVSSHEHTIFMENDQYHGYGSNYHNQLGHSAKSRISKNLFFK